VKKSRAKRKKGAKNLKIFRYKKPKPEIYVPKGYELEDMLETDEQGYEPGEPMETEEVRVRFEKDEAERRNI
jgi:hypothetical protein